MESCCDKFNHFFLTRSLPLSRLCCQYLLFRCSRSIIIRARCSECEMHSVVRENDTHSADVIDFYFLYYIVYAIINKCVLGASDWRRQSRRAQFQSFFCRVAAAISENNHSHCDSAAVGIIFGSRPLMNWEECEKWLASDWKSDTH